MIGLHGHVGQGMFTKAQPQKLRFSMWGQIDLLRQRLVQRKLRRRGWYSRSARSNEPAIFIGGCGRSGTTLFREMLNRHSRICCGPETSMFASPFAVRKYGWRFDLDEALLRKKADECKTLVEFAEWFFGRYRDEQGKARWADKTPNNVHVVASLLRWFPNATFIHMIRDGRDVACSLRHHPREAYVRGKLVAVQTNNPIRKCARRWFRDVAMGLAFQTHPRYCEVRYEELAADPERQCRRICQAVGEDFEPAMLHHRPAGAIDKAASRLMNNPNASDGVSQQSVGRWRRDLTPDERVVFGDIAGELLIALGYAQDDAWINA
jgi:protein-tyrosine sulfotransferase